MVCTIKIIQFRMLVLFIPTFNNYFYHMIAKQLFYSFFFIYNYLRFS